MDQKKIPIKNSKRIFLINIIGCYFIGHFLYVLTRLATQGFTSIVALLNPKFYPLNLHLGMGFLLEIISFLAGIYLLQKRSLGRWLAIIVSFLGPLNDLLALPHLQRMQAQVPISMVSLYAAFSVLIIVLFLLKPFGQCFLPGQRHFPLFLFWFFVLIGPIWIWGMKLMTGFIFFRGQASVFSKEFLDFNIAPNILHTLTNAFPAWLIALGGSLLLNSPATANKKIYLPRLAGIRVSFMLFLLTTFLYIPLWHANLNGQYLHLETLLIFPAGICGLMFFGYAWGWASIRFSTGLPVTFRIEDNLIVNKPNL